MQYIQEVLFMIVHHSDCVMCSRKGVKSGATEALSFRGRLFPFCASHADQLFDMLAPNEDKKEGKGKK
ncbi:hypothetical protein ADL27_32545 [Streptomyces sp. NRRL F-6602]|nr:hypothetical protein ADL27_32545 [Streptomyces sp. NRRL F-6602]